MSAVPGNRLERRLLILAPIGKDAALVESILKQEGIACAPCRSMDHLSAELTRGASALLIAEEAFAEHDGQLATLIDEQPPWSDLPILLLTRKGADSVAVAKALETLGNVTLLERPVRVLALASSVRTALRARRRQYQTRAHMQERDEADERKDKFLATLAHELRNPLAPIRTALDILRQSSGERHKIPIYDIMGRQLAHLVRLVDDLMEVSRITRGKIDLRKESVNLASVISDAVETSRPLITASRHELTVKLPEQPVLIEADAVRLAQVFTNLLNNAAKYTNAGGRITITAGVDAGHAVVNITDTGIGIAPESLSRVFEMFTQIGASDRHVQAGLGIGLTLVRSLVEMHGGTVTAASEGPGRGSTFSVHLPLGSGSYVGSAPARDAATALAGSPRILVVDDNRDAADTLGMLLQSAGAKVHVAYNGASALVQAAAFRPRVAILDIGMPGMDGYELARQMRELDDTITFIALTGRGNQQDLRNSTTQGFSHHLVKPVSFEAIQSVLDSLTAQHE